MKNLFEREWIYTRWKLYFQARKDFGCYVYIGTEDWYNSQCMHLIWSFDERNAIHHTPRTNTIHIFYDIRVWSEMVSVRGHLQVFLIAWKMARADPFPSLGTKIISPFRYDDNFLPHIRVWSYMHMLHITFSMYELWQYSLRDEFESLDAHTSPTHYKRHLMKRFTLWQRVCACGIACLYLAIHCTVKNDSLRYKIWLCMWSMHICSGRNYVAINKTRLTTI